MPLDSLKNQILRNIIHHEVSFNNFLLGSWFPSTPFYKTKYYAICSPHGYLQWFSLHTSKPPYLIFFHFLLD
ncbi:hypothetical protein JHK87_003025 [Glycine soja]|nr:hypothetical protein JHK87_003025 [Glycine soja]